MCLNGWGGNLHDPLIAYLRASDPDVLCLQEVAHTPSSARDWLTYRAHDTVLEQRANFFRDVCAALPDHTAIFCPAAEGDLWHGEVRYASLWGLATFVRRTIPIIAQVQGFVHGAFSPDGYGEHPRPRPGHAIRIYDAATRHASVIAQMHGLRDLDGKHDTPARLAQAQRFANLIQSIAEPDDHMIACGDFNVLPDSATFEVLRENGLTDLVTTRGFTDTRTSHYPKPNRYADYLLVNGAVRVNAFDVVQEPEVSDHRPLLLDFG